MYKIPKSAHKEIAEEVGAFFRRSLSRTKDFERSEEEAYDKVMLRLARSLVQIINSKIVQKNLDKELKKWQKRSGKKSGQAAKRTAVAHIFKSSPLLEDGVIAKCPACGKDGVRLNLNKHQFAYKHSADPKDQHVVSKTITTVSRRIITKLVQ